ncbi:IclR family transcriptional regulator [Nocardia sp. CA2R105]|uniref:IclR family transcriptional regulator n=1 Tax=Nocardia coffeae TaxID=2873381 RepID=UPI001CA6A2B0|nr:IclR family transcriptional regulator [Nocardia coffeae]MBY8859090.1 IclR family transcriptional regulator [Nocardia coffeae]
MASTTTHDDRRSVLDKVTRILTAFRDEDLSLSLTDITQRTGIAKATTHRLCQDLIATGLLEREGTRYQLSMRLYQLGLRAAGQRLLGRAARPVMEDLAQRLNNTAVLLAVPQGGELLCIEHAGSHRIRVRSAESGRQMRLCSSAAGKLTVAMLPAQFPLAEVTTRIVRRTPRTLTAAQFPAELERIRQRGYATESEESRIGYQAVAVPVLDNDRTYRGVLSAIAPTASSTLARLLAELTSATRAISVRLARETAYAAPL